MNYSKDDALEELANSMLEDDSAKTVSSFMKRYPEYADDILEYAVLLLSTNKYPMTDPFENEQEKSRFLHAANEVYLNTIDQSKTVPFSGIRAKLKELEIDSEKFRAATGLTSFLVLNLDQKLVDVASIPSRILKSISETLSVPTYALRDYLHGGLPSQGIAHFKNSSAPISSVKKSFDVIVKEDVNLSEEEKLELIQ
jgi:hypothetical protein